MAAYNKYQDFVLQLVKGVHQLHAAGHTTRLALSNSAPNAATHTVKADATELGGGNGYTAGGEDTQNDASNAAGTVSVTGVDIVWTGSGAGFGPFRYAFHYNDTPASPLDPLINWWDYGSAISVLAAETFTADFGSSIFTLT
jgi:hypothetical protein